MAHATTSTTDTNVNSSKLTHDRRNFRDMTRGFKSLSIIDQEKSQRDRDKVVRAQALKRHTQKDRLATKLLQSYIDIHNATMTLDTAQSQVMPDES